ncbi:MAG TPA: tetratricopeptide repeat protein [Bacteroidota bacterium]|nr:tetratricopeptide repeat protein [Bacteroidota bacterium]
MILRRLSLLMLLAGAAHELPAQTPEEMLRQANQLYQQGKFSEARDAYGAILKGGYESPELLYNLGNACYKSGSVPGAILNYERARRLLPGDDDLRHNLQIANMMITDRIEPTPRLFVWDYWDGIKNFLSLSSLTLTVYFFYFVVAAMASVFFLSRTYALRKIAVLAGSGSFLLFLFFLVVFIARLGDVTRTDEAVVMAPIVTVKNSPDAKSSDAFVLHGGVKVQLVDRVESWSKVRLADGKVGWLEGSAVEVI